jgi:hypothetical protein
MPDDDIDPTDDPAGKSPCTHPGRACQNFVSSAPGARSSASVAMARRSTACHFENVQVSSRAVAAEGLILALILDRAS